MTFTMRTALGAGLVTAALGIGCGGGEKTEGQAPPMTTLAAPPAVAAGEFGVPECDNYMKKYIACLDSKIPEAARPMMRQQLDQTKMVWQQAAATPQGKAGLAMGCQQADQASKPAMKAYGCAW
jgi:hypothetical protein